MRIPKLTDLIHSPGFDLDRNRGAERRRARRGCGCPKGRRRYGCPKVFSLVQSRVSLCRPRQPRHGRGRSGSRKSMVQCGTHGRASRHFGPAFPESAGFSQTGCMNASLQATSQTWRRTHVLPGRSTRGFSSACPNEPVSDRSTRWRETFIEPGDEPGAPKGRTRRDHRSPAGAEDLPRCGDTTRRPRPPGSPPHESLALSDLLNSRQGCL